MNIAKTEGGFIITRPACIVCGEPPFGDHYCCGHSQQPSPRKQKLQRIIARAIRIGNVKNNLVICDHCDTPASKSLSLDVSWVGCAACMLGEAKAVDPRDFIHVPANRRAK